MQDYVFRRNKMLFCSFNPFCGFMIKLDLWGFIKKYLNSNQISKEIINNALYI